VPDHPRSGSGAPGSVRVPDRAQDRRSRCGRDVRGRCERDDPPPRRGGRVTPAQIALLGGHSLRAGFVTEAFRAGADAHAIMRQTGHRSPAMLEVYAREHAPLTGNAVTRLGL
jgi:integrase